MVLLNILRAIETSDADIQAIPAHGCIKTRAVRIATQILERAGWLMITFVKRCLKLVSLTPIGERWLKEGIAGDVQQKTVDDLKRALECRHCKDRSRNARPHRYQHTVR